MVGGYRETIVGCKDDDCWLQRRRLVVAEKTIGGCRGDDGGCREDGCWLQRLRLVVAENTIGGYREDDWWRIKKNTGTQRNKVHSSLYLSASFEKAARMAGQLDPGVFPFPVGLYEGSPPHHPAQLLPPRTLQER